MENSDWYTWSHCGCHSRSGSVRSEYVANLVWKFYYTYFHFMLVKLLGLGATKGVASLICHTLGTTTMVFTSYATTSSQPRTATPASAKHQHQSATTATMPALDPATPHRHKFGSALRLSARKKRGALNSDNIACQLPKCSHHYFERPTELERPSAIPQRTQGTAPTTKTDSATAVVRKQSASMSLTNCRFFENKFPEIDSFVMVNVKQVGCAS